MRGDASTLQEDFNGRVRHRASTFAWTS
jgi:hypothetical protein